MNNERNHSQQAGDRKVSAAYRDIAAERTPERLDEAVLRRARRAARPQYATSMLWLRPVAWVATVGLCLAVVLEIAEMPQVTDEIARPAADAIGNNGPIPDLDEPDAVPATRAAQEVKRSLPVPAEPGLSAELHKSESREAATEADGFIVEELEATTAADMNALREDVPAAIEPASLATEKVTFMRDAEQRARLQSGNNDEVAARPFERQAPAQNVESAAFTVGAAAIVERHCEPGETETRAAWLACIVDLEQQGNHDAAEAERRLLDESFPIDP